MKSRLGDYRRLLEAALRADYRVMSIETMWSLIARGSVDPDSRYLILRHDIDTDPGTAREMWMIEQSLGLQSSWFFRWSTLDVDLMHRIDAAGGNASYHYEELATLAKKYRIRDLTAAQARLPEARDLFRYNVERLRNMSGLPIRIVASHGDFVNRKLRISNTAVLADPGFRDKVGVDLETYDQSFMQHVTARFSDGLPPSYWQPTDPSVAIAHGQRVVYLLVHPRNWRRDRWANARDDVQRLVDGVTYAFPGSRRQDSSAAAPVGPVTRGPMAADLVGSDSASIRHPRVALGPGAQIGPFVVLGEPMTGKAPGDEGLSIGPNARIRSHTVMYAGSVIGADFQTGHGVLVREATKIGDGVSVGSHTVIEHHVTIGNGVRIHSNVFIPEFSVLEDGAWVGPNAVFTNARYPLSPSAKHELAGPLIRSSAKIGANVTLLPGVVVGRNSLVGAGSVVTRDVPDDAIVVGNPARVVGSVSEVPAYADTVPASKRRSKSARSAR